MRNKTTGVTLTNGSSNYFIISADNEKDPQKLLLQRIPDNEIIIARYPTFIDDKNFYWGSGTYFGRDLKAAVKEFNG
jgi:hypothetical protein